MPRLSKAARVWALVAAMVVVVVALVRSSVGEMQGPLAHHTMVAPLLLVAMFLLAELLYVQVIFGREGYSFSLTEIPLVVGLWLSTGPVLLVALTLGNALAYFFHRRHRGVKLSFNVTKAALESAVAITVFDALGAGNDPFEPRAILATMAASAAAVAVATTTIAAAITLHQGGTDVRKLLVTSLGNVVATVTNASIGLVAVILVSAAAPAVLLLLPPAVVVLASYGSVIQSRRKNESLEFLYESGRILHRGMAQAGPMVDLLELARRTLGAGMAELVLYSADDPSRALRTSVGPGEEVRRLEPVVSATTERRADSRAAARTVSAELQGERHPLGRIAVSEPSASRRSFSSHERRLFSTLATQVAVALENGALEANLADLTARKEELHHMAFHDDLTGLANRALFVDALTRAVRQAPVGMPPAVLFVDLDDFKSVNDTMGHAAGDALLVEVAKRLRQSVRPGDVPARLGGDEFAVLLAGADSKQAAGVVAGRLLSLLTLPVAVGSEPVSVSASVGIAVGVGGVRDAEELLRNADVAMYEAKLGGKGRASTFPSETASPGTRRASRRTSR